VKDLEHFLISSTFGVVSSPLTVSFWFASLALFEYIPAFFAFTLSPSSLLIDQAVGHSSDDCSEFLCSNSVIETVANCGTLFGCWDA